MHHVPNLALQQEVPCQVFETIITQPKLAVRQTSGQTRTQTSLVPVLGCLHPHLLRAAALGHLIILSGSDTETSCDFYDIGLSPAHSMLRRSHTWRAGGQACGAAAGQSRLHGHVPCQVHECGVQYASWFLQSCGVGLAGRMYVSS